jgi:hypothetical protein
MTKATILLGIVLGGALLASPASAATVEWRGGGFLSTQSQACLDDGYRANEYVSVRFRPKGLGDNGDYSKLSFFHPLFFATSYLRKGNFTKSYKAVSGGGTGSSTWFFASKVKLKAQLTPSKVGESTETVRIVGGIKNYGDTAGCDMTFDVSVTKRP